MTIKYLTNNLFDNAGFAEMLNTIGVHAEAVEGGVILDRTAFNAIKAYNLSEWARVNKKFINSEYHTEEV